MTPRLAHSTLILTATQAVYNGGLALEVALLGRWLDLGDLGAYFAILALASQFEVGVHWGSQHLVNREAAARFEVLNTWLPGLVAASLITVALVFTGISAAYGPVLATIAAAALMRAGLALLGGICIGRGRILAPAISRVLSPAAKLSGLVLLVRPEPTLDRLAMVVCLTTAAYAAPLLWAHGRLGTALWATPAHLLSAWRWLGANLWPFVVLFSLTQLLYRIDPALLEWLAGEETAGLFGLGFKWVEGLFFLPFVVASAAIPALVAVAATGDSAAVRRTMGRISLWLLLATTAAAVVLLVAGEPLLRLVIGARFAAAAPVYRLVVWLLPVHGLGVFFAAALVSLGRERQLLLVTALAAFASLTAKVAGWHAGGIEAFAAGIYVGLLVHAAGCAWLLWPGRGTSPSR